MCYTWVGSCVSQVVTLTPRSIGGVVMAHALIQSHVHTLLDPTEDDDEPTSDAPINTNHMLATEQSLQWKEQHQQQHQHQQQQQAARIRQQKSAEIAKTLLTKRVTREEVDVLAQRDLDITSGKVRGKHAMHK